MSENDGNVQMAIGIDKGKVIVHFEHPMQDVIFDPENAIAIATSMTDMAFEANTGLKPVGESLKAELIERHRVTLTNRYAMILGTLRGDKKKSNHDIAKTMVDAALSEIF